MAKQIIDAQKKEIRQFDQWLDKHKGCALVKHEEHGGGGLTKTLDVAPCARRSRPDSKDDDERHT